MAPVDYDAVAARYRAGRSLDGAQLAVWGAVVGPHLPAHRPLRVLDLGAGTGTFARAWPGWVDCRVVAVEPSAGMRAELAATASDGPVDVVGGRAEALPLQAASVDVAWLSAVLHHLGPPEAWAGELARVVAPGGLALVRGLFADRGRGPGWLTFFPDDAAERARAVFPDSRAALPGFSLVASVEVDEPGAHAHAHSLAETGAWIRRMRDADTLLGQFSDDEIDAACGALAARPPDEPLAPVQLTLLVYTRSG